MPKQKDLKRIVRSRMEKTGEAYTTARAQVLRKANLPQRAQDDAAAIMNHEPGPPSADFAALAGMSDAKIAEKTGRTWQEWTATLDALGAQKMPHRDIARHVNEVLGVDGWWAQSVTVGYERIRGLREKGQRRGGDYEVNKSKTVPVPLAALWKAWESARTRGKWLGEPGVKVRRATPEKTLRLTWSDGTSVECYFTAKGEGKSAVAVQHRGLASREAADAAREAWTARLAALAALLTDATS